jgi:hypothetical protein
MVAIDVQKDEMMGSAEGSKIGIDQSEEWSERWDDEQMGQ